MNKTDITNTKSEKFQFFKNNFGSCLSWAVTIAWLMFIYCKIYNGVIPKNLNEFGDFVAGAFAPLAFFWLVRGFYQQGHGLEQNSKALKMQAEELSQSTLALNAQVEEQKKLFVATEKQLAINMEKNNFDIFSQKKQFQPYFHIKNLKAKSHVFLNPDIVVKIVITFELTNSRATCRNLFFSYNYEGESTEDFLIIHERIQLFSNSKDVDDIYLEIKNLPIFDDDGKCKMILRLSYTDALDTIQYQCICLYLKKISSYISIESHQMCPQTLY